MPKVALYNNEGSQVGEITLDDSIFATDINETLMHEAVNMHLASKRRGTASAKTRSEVRGGGRKPWRQKGTGRARHGSIRSPIWVGGGISFAPKPRDYSYKMPKKAKRKAIKSALTTKLNNGEIVILEELTMEAPKTKKIIEMLENLSINHKAMIVTGASDLNVYRSTRNIPGVSSALANNLNVYDVLNHDYLVLTKDAVSVIEEVFC
ncbi:50S ribosomal protein L4 [Natranaerobius thermophilus]|uniref:Large ribosomal subunit protein uL4 n=1 Tax=Natranaerobius thermophilus (strain ATCC BAA-1301 / DSM 18059 / JW/NM-WN-LF) TaxID=457570 RepID=RL4_NATTJ|nr:50S ribosomal protein L4 [Natranaerobius thermophilus]B2A4E0.1 RecName: Full=Large ribosomal subunit protein uL4; AltName: Full=50S ribosomal protein L4 [Natranaerobius thermophilus JW/NM-WN-LF]ACB83794.1 LSU ribosomal protein L4P [Natranaerobius thermophilus JW/NM-WN-LF]